MTISDETNLGEEAGPEFWEEQYRLSATNWASWFLSACTHRRSARVLRSHWDKAHVKWRNGELTDEEARFDLSIASYSLLMGLSIELACKALYVLRNERELPPGEVLPQPFPPRGLLHHRLAALFECLSIATSEDEQELLRRLTSVIEWSGKYPVPKRINDYLTKSRGWVLPRDPDLAEQLFERVQALLNEEGGPLRGFDGKPFDAAGPTLP